MRYSGFLIFLMLFVYLELPAKEMAPVISAKANKSNALVGEIITLKIEVIATNSSKLNWQLVDKALASTEILKNTIKESDSNFLRKTERTFLFTSGDSGKLALGNLRVIIASGNRIDTLFSKPISVHFQDEKLIAGLHGIKPQQPVRFTFFQHPVVWVPGIFLFLFLLAVPGYFKFLRTKKAISNSGEEQALRDVAKLEETLKRQQLQNAEVTRELTFILEKAIQNREHLLQQTKTLGNLNQKLNRLQFGPDADKPFQEKALINEIKMLVQSPQKVREEMV